MTEPRRAYDRVTKSANRLTEEVMVKKNIIDMTESRVSDMREEIIDIYDELKGLPDVDQLDAAVSSTASYAFRAEAAADRAMEFGPRTVKDAAEFFAKTSLEVGRYSSQDGLAWDVLASGTGDFVHPITNNPTRVVNKVGVFASEIIGSSAASQLEKSFKAATRLSYGDNSFGGGEQRMVDVLLEPGALYDFGSEGVELNTNDRNVNLVCNGGRATIRGSGVGITHPRARNLTYKNINLVGFDVASRWETANVDGNLINYDGVWFIDNKLGVDTVSYNSSRSTVLQFTNCRSARTLQLVKSYCDFLTLRDNHFRNHYTEANEDLAFVEADSQVLIDGGIWTPYSVHPRARWIDINNISSAAWGSRSLTVRTTRFGPESDGGIPIVYSKLSGNTAQGSRTTVSHIAFEDVFAGSANTTTPGLIVMLAKRPGDNKVYWPNSVSFRGGSFNAQNGLVGMESGGECDAIRGTFNILVDNTVAGRSGSQTTGGTWSVTPPSLEKYTSGHHKPPKTITATSSGIVERGSANVIALGLTSAETVLNLNDPIDGEKVEIVFTNGNSTLKCWTSSDTTGKFVLAGGTNWSPASGGTITMVYLRAQARWYELSRKA